MTELEAILGQTLIDNKGKSYDVSELSSEYVFFYFSASWCPPCRLFTPKLIDFYNKHSQTKKFEVVFLSQDQDEDSFDAYFAKMPFKSLPFEESSLLRQQLMQRYGVRGIPTLILLDASGKVVCKDARYKIESADEEASQFPFCSTSKTPGACCGGGGCGPAVHTPREPVPITYVIIGIMLCLGMILSAFGGGR